MRDLFDELGPAHLLVGLGALVAGVLLGALILGGSPPDYGERISALEQGQATIMERIAEVRTEQDASTSYLAGYIDDQEMEPSTTERLLQDVIRDMMDLPSPTPTPAALMEQ